MYGCVRVRVKGDGECEDVQVRECEGGVCLG